jgi:response regulator RpfG family c-di-GMP phosphodiesterase
MTVQPDPADGRDADDREPLLPFPLAAIMGPAFTDEDAFPELARVDEPHAPGRRVLLIEDDEEDYLFTLDLLRRIAPTGYELHWASDYRSGLAACRAGTFDVCLVDYRLGAESGIDLAHELVSDGSTIPIILLTGQDDRELDARAASVGATDFLVKGEVSATILERAIRYAIGSHTAARALADSYRTTVRALAAALDLRDDQTGAHAMRVTALALRLTQVVAPELATDQELEFGFLLHDIGKIGVPDAIILKPGPLEPEEFERMKGHVTLGERIVAEVPYLRGIAAEIIHSHHEHWDGSGYPSGLRGLEIPIAARIFSVVDSFDAITNDRPYRPAQPIEHALDEIERNAGTQFDPDIAQTFLRFMRDTQQQTRRAA